MDEEKQLNDIVNALKDTQDQMSRLRHQEKYLKTQIHLYMNSRNINRFRTQYWVIRRLLRRRCAMLKNNVPPEVWDEYCTNVEYPYLELKTRIDM